MAGDPTQPPYFTEDTLIGVQNDSSQPLSSLPLFSTTGKNLFAFDQDGLCTVSNAPAGCPFGTTGYEGPGVSFANIDANTQSGTVQFSPAIPPGGHTYFSLEEALSTVPPYDFSPGATYAALGDSFSAGEGNAPYGWGSAFSSSNKCDRSASSAYPPLLDAFASLGPIAFVACSGAVTEDLFQYNIEGNVTPDGSLEPAQLCGAMGATSCPSGTLPWLSPTTKTVTLTIGGNDVGFEEVLEECIKVSVGPFDFSQGKGDCLRDHKLSREVYARIAALAGHGNARPPNGGGIISIADILSSIHQAAPNAHVYIAGYPLLFPLSGPHDNNCKVGTVKVTNAFVLTGVHDATIKFHDQVDLDLAGLALNDVISAAARSAGAWATYVNPLLQFDEHAFCGKQSLWFNELYAEYDFKSGKRTSLFPGSLHPNSGGQLGYAESFLEAGI